MGGQNVMINNPNVAPPGQQMMQGAPMQGGGMIVNKPVTVMQQQVPPQPNMNMNQQLGNQSNQQLKMQLQQTLRGQPQAGQQTPYQPKLVAVCFGCSASKTPF